MRNVLSVEIIAALAITLAGPGEAQQRRARDEGYSPRDGNGWSRNRADTDSFTTGRRGDTKDDIDARANDPGGDYASYPAWARKSLGGNKDSGQ